MTNDEALTLIEFIGAAYPGSFSDPATVELYVAMLGRYRPDDALDAAEAWIVEHEFPPKVAQLVGGIQEAARDRASSVAVRPPAIEARRDDQLNEWGYAVTDRIRQRVLGERRTRGRVLTVDEVAAIVDAERGSPATVTVIDGPRPYSWQPDADGTVACVECGDSGWLELGRGLRPCSTCRTVDYAVWVHRTRHDDHGCKDCRVLAHNASHKTKKQEPQWLQQARQVAADHDAGRLIPQPVGVF